MYVSNFKDLKSVIRSHGVLRTIKNAPSKKALLSRVGGN